MDRISSRNLTMQIAFARTLAPALLLLSGLACSQATIGGGDRGVLTVKPGLSGQLKKNDQNTKNYKNNRVKFESYHPEVSGRFRQSSGNTVEIKVKAEKTAHVRNWHQAMNNWEGYIVARIENVNRVNVPELGLTASDQYAYIWIGELPSGRGISFYTFENNGDLKDKGSLNLDHFRFCRDYTGSTPRATFGKNHSDAAEICEPPGPAPISPARANASVQLTSYTPKPTRSVTSKAAGSAWMGGLWISCSGGCCDVGGGSFF